MLQPVAELCLQLFHFERATHVARKSADYPGTKSYIILFYISQRKRTVDVYGSLSVCNTVKAVDREIFWVQRSPNRDRENNF